MSITFKNVAHTYNEGSPFSYAALKNINLNIPEGKVTAVIGETGSGKTTLVQHLNALLLPSEGELEVLGKNIVAKEKPKNLKALRKQVGLVFQFPEYQLFEETIEKDIIFGPMNFGVNEDEAKLIACKVLKTVGLDESYLDKSPFDLSGGQKRRVAIAGILAMDPDILILDEPTAGLDPQGTNEMMSLFKKINDSGKTIILVTHDMNHVLQYCDEVVVMNHGKVEKHDTVTNIFKDSGYLNNLGIDLPIITEFILKLNNRGFNIDSSINNIEDLISAIGGELNG